MFNGTVVMQSGGASEYYSLALPVLLRCICPPPDLLPLVPITLAARGGYLSSQRFLHAVTEAML